MATLRQVVVGGITGELITAACAHIVKDVRGKQIESVNAYQHKQPEADTVPFLDVYSTDRDVSGKAAGFVYNNHAIYPEMVLEFWSLERVIVTEDVRTSSRHFSKALVIFRASEGRTLRLWVEVEKKFASNGNNFSTDRIVWNASKEEADFEEKEADEAERELQGASA